MRDWKFYDDMVLKKHIRTTGCRAPYHASYKWFPICTTREEIKQSIYEFYLVGKQYYPKACQRISKIDFILQHRHATKGILMVIINYPDDIKIITQSKEVDGHALIGNIGGYIGLFLGNIYNTIMRTTFYWTHFV